MNRLKFSWIPETRSVQLLDHFYYFSKEYKRTISVMKGFTSDGASVPRVFWSIFPPFGRYLEAAVLHDWMLSNMEEFEYSLEMCNKIFKEALKDCGIPKWKVYTMYWAVKGYTETLVWWRNK